jgi:hypothetical protein
MLFAALLVLLLDEQRVLVLMGLERLARVEHDDALETAEVYRQLLMRQLHLLDYGFHLRHRDLLAHARQAGR